MYSLMVIYLFDNKMKDAVGEGCSCQQLFDYDILVRHTIIINHTSVWHWI